MSALEFTWDVEKAASNEVKHGVSFEEARTVFLDESARLIFDPDHSEMEDRYVLMSISERLRVVLVCHAYQHGHTIRIISARRANRLEQRQYEELRDA